MAIKKIETLNKHQNPATNENQFDIENYMNVNWDKIKEVVDNNADELTTTQGKVTALETDNTKNKQDVSDIKSEQETQNDLLERTQNALINITTEKSSNINVKDSSNLNAKIGVFGISEQETRSGYNLFNNTKTISNVTYNSEEDKWIFDLSGKYDHIASKGTFFKNIKANTNYTIYFNILKNTSNNTITFNASKTIWDTNLNIQAGQTGIVISNIKTKEDLSTALYDLWFSHPITITGEFEVQIMLLEGTFTLQNIPNYEKYGASPTPEFKSDIENVEGNVDITVCNKNLFNCLKWLKMNHSAGYPVAITDNTNTAIEIIKETKNSIKYNQKSAYYGVLSEYIPVKKGQIFTLSFNYVNINRLFVTQYDKDKTRIKELNNTGNVNTTTFTVEQDGFITIAFSYSNATPNENTIEITNIQLEVGTVKTDYIENEQQTITFPLQEGQKLYKGDYPASDGIHHKRTQVEINGTEANWVYYSANDTWARPYILLSNKKIGENNNTANALCNKAKSISWADMTAGLNKYSIFTYEEDNRISIAVKKEDLETQDTAGVKKYFQENNMVVEYNLAEEEIEPYTPEQQEAYNKLQNAQSYYNVTNVFTDKALLEFKYIADTQTWTVNLVKSEVANTNQQILEIAGGN